VQTASAQAGDGWPGEFGGAAAAGGGVDDGEEGFSHAIRTPGKS